ncbi:MAG: copper amine oxidase N-terminal domain-containing protein [Carboxydocellales bacterium]
MKKYLAGLLTGLILATATTSFAIPQVIKLFVDGKELKPDVPPQVINGRTLVPARALAEALGAKVEWDAAKNAVVVTSDTGGAPTDLAPVTPKPSAPSINPTPGYYSGREIVDTLGKKYPGTKIALSPDGVLNFGERKYKMAVETIQNRNYYAIASLIDDGIIAKEDF